MPIEQLLNTSYPVTDQPVQADELPSTLNFTNNIAQWRNEAPASEVLDKIHGFFNLPIFNVNLVAFNSTPYTYIVKQFNFSASGNFTITGYPSFPSNPNYVLCIRYNKGGVVYRYKIWSYIDDCLYYPLYTGQPIMKNFCLEVWNYVGSGVTLVSQLDTSIQFQSSRTQLRISAVNATSYVEGTGIPVVTMFNTNSLPVPAIDTTNLIFHFDPTTGITVTTGHVTAWIDTAGNNLEMINDGTGPTSITSSIGKEVLFGAGQALKWAGANAPVINVLYLVLRTITWSINEIIAYFGAGTIAYRNVSPQLNIVLGINFYNVTLLNESIGSTYIIEIPVTTGLVNAFTLGGLVNEALATIPDSNVVASNLAFGGSGNTSSFALYDIIGYSAAQTTAARTKIINYLLNKYNATNPLLPNPLTFNADAADGNN